MKSRKLLTLFVSLLIFASYGCSDNNLADLDPADPPSPAAFKSLKDSAIKARTQTKQFDAEDGITFTSEKGVVLSISAGCLTLDGSPASGTADLEYIELFNRENMLVTNKPVMGVTPNGEKKNVGFRRRVFH